jgi:hypothetical protein
MPRAWWQNCPSRLVRRGGARRKTDASDSLGEEPALERGGRPHPLRVLRIIAGLNVGGPAGHVTILDMGLGRRGVDTRLAHGNVGEGEATLEGNLGRAGSMLVGGAARARSPLTDGICIPTTDGDGRSEIVLGLGAGGWFEVLDNTAATTPASDGSMLDAPSSR